MSRTYYGAYLEFAIDIGEDGEPNVVVTKKFVNKLNKGNSATENLKRKKAPKEVVVTQSEEREL